MTKQSSTLHQLLFTPCYRENNKHILFQTAGDTIDVLSFQELFDLALDQLAHFQKLGLRVGDKLVLAVEDPRSFLICFHACWLGGIISAPLSAGEKEKIQRVVKVIQPVYVVSDANKMLKLSCPVLHPADISSRKTEPVLFESTPADVAYLQFSSGATGSPKGIILTHENLVSNIQAIAERMELSAEVSSSWMPLFHDMGLIGFHLTPLVYGYRHILSTPTYFLRRPLSWLQKVAEEKVSVIGSPNFGYDYILRHCPEAELHKLDLSDIRLILNGAEPISPTLVRRFLKTMAPSGLDPKSMYPVYGMAEASLAVTMPRPGQGMETLRLEAKALKKGRVKIAENKEGEEMELVSAGFPVTDCEISIGTPDGQDCPAGMLGDIFIRGKNVTLGYFGQAERKSDWLNTGDRGFIHQGNLYISGRTKEMIIFNGLNLYPQDIEHKIIQQVETLHFGEVAASSFMDTEKERTLVFVKYRGKEGDFLKLARRIRSVLIQHYGMLDALILPVKKIPRTTSGKIQRFILKQEFNKNRLIESKSDDYKNDLVDVEKTEDRILKACQNLLERSDFSIHDHFLEWTNSSLVLAQLAAEIESLYPQVSITDFFSYPNIHSLAAFIDRRQEDSKSTQKQPGLSEEPIAIIGMAIRLPGTTDLDIFWHHLENKYTKQGKLKGERLADVKAFLQNIGEERSLLSASFLDEIDQFDPDFFRLKPKEAALMDPRGRIFLEMAVQALGHAGYRKEELQHTLTGVFMGMITGMEHTSYLDLIRQITPADLPRAITGNLPSLMPSRLAYLLDLKGPAVLIDTACSSSLSAVHLAIQSIRNGDCRMALVGAVRIYAVPTDNGIRLGMESPDGTTYAFDQRAHGTGSGEGGSVIVLKTLREALKDQDQILAVIKSSAINNDGASAGITAPNLESQKAMLTEAWNRSHISPEQIAYIEAHGTGTRLGDPIEVKAIQQAFQQFKQKNTIHYGAEHEATFCFGEPSPSERKEKGSRKQQISKQPFAAINEGANNNPTNICALGSVKANVGHLFEAAGLIGLVKTVLCLQNRKIPPQANYERPNELLELEKSPVFINKEAIELPPEPELYMGVSSFGFSGTNCHLVLSSAPKHIAARQPLSVDFHHKRCWLDIPLPAETPSVKETIPAPGIELEEQSSLLDTVLELIEQNTGIPREELEPEESFFQLGIDSIELLQVKQQVEHRYEIEIPMRILLKDDACIRTVVLEMEERIRQKRVGGNGQETASAATPAPSGKHFVAYRGINRQKDELKERQREYLAELIDKIISKTGRSKELTQQYRPVWANNRNIAGFRPLLKEIIYQVVTQQASGAEFTDVDGNRFIDLTCGFGVYFFGHNPAFIKEAVAKQLELGVPIGPMSTDAGKVAALICQLTGSERVAFYNSGTEAVMVAIRLARTVTRRDKIVLFAGAYHGTFDGVLALPSGNGSGGSIPLAPGVTASLVQDVIVLEYGSEEALDYIREHGSELAAVLVEPVQSRRPDLQPAEFLKKLREMTANSGTALIFDEVITGFRIHPGGAQAWFDVRADIVTYGKIAGGGYPVGIVAGKSQYLDAIDGGMWQYGDDSMPEKLTTFVAGTFNQHPLAMTAGLAALTRFKEEGEDLTRQLNEKTARFCRAAECIILQKGVLPYTAGTLSDRFSAL
jgi:glutamate-1-semialdehyde aminotransferase/acyl-CoA synthetase (AMP-forming)/AMP-acid ligase II/3-oxoacyl-(acyl-carrier-protein) synthase/acyl carrier protein